MQIENLIQQRRTIHDYNNDPVSDDIINKCLELALWAPNHRLTYPWKFVLVGSVARAKIGDLSVELKAKKDPSKSELVKAKIKEKFMSASHMIVLVQKKSDDPDQSKEDYATMACSVQNMSLYLWSEGVGSKWSTGGITRHPHVYNWLGLNEAEEEIIGFLWAGMADRIPAAPKRPALSEVLVRVE